MKEFCNGFNYFICYRRYLTGHQLNFIKHIQVILKFRNIRIRGFGWKTIHHAWSKEGYTYTGDELKDHLFKNIFPYEFKQRIPSVPSVNLPTRQKKL